MITSITIINWNFLVNSCAFIRVVLQWSIHTLLQSQKAVSAYSCYLQSKQILPFGFARQYKCINHLCALPPPFVPGGCPRVAHVSLWLDATSIFEVMSKITVACALLQNKMWDLIIAELPGRHIFHNKLSYPRARSAIPCFIEQRVPLFKIARYLECRASQDRPIREPLTRGWQLAESIACLLPLVW